MVWSSKYPKIAIFVGENNDEPLHLGELYFQSNQTRHNEKTGFKRPGAQETRYDENHLVVAEGTTFGLVLEFVESNQPGTCPNLAANLGVSFNICLFVP